MLPWWMELAEEDRCRRSGLGGKRRTKRRRGKRRRSAADDGARCVSVRRSYMFHA